MLRLPDFWPPGPSSVLVRIATVARRLLRRRAQGHVQDEKCKRDDNCPGCVSLEKKMGDSTTVASSRRDDAESCSLILA